MFVRNNFKPQQFLDSRKEEYFTQRTAEVAHAGAEQTLDDLLGSDGDKKEPWLHLATHLRAAAESCGSHPPIHPGGGPALCDKDQTLSAQMSGRGQVEHSSCWSFTCALLRSHAAKPSFNTTQCTVKQGPPPNIVLAIRGLCYSLWADKFKLTDPLFTWLKKSTG